MNDTQIHLPTAEAPTVSNEYARCKVCGCQWQIKADSDKEGCAFCGSNKDAIVIINEDVND